MELYFGQSNSSIESPPNGNTIKLDSDSSEFDFSVGSPTASFTAAMQTPHHLFPLPACTSFPAMREAIFLEAAMQPVEVDEESLRAAPERRNVRLSTDPQSVAARRRRERISHKMRVLQRLVPGGTKMDTASMLDEACHFLKFLERRKHQLLQQEEEGCAQVYRPEMPFSHTSN